MKSRLIDLISRFLDRNRSSIGSSGVKSSLSFDMILQSVKLALVFTKEDEYEI